MKQEIWGEKKWCESVLEEYETVQKYLGIAQTHLAFPDLAVLDIIINNINILLLFIIINIMCHCFIVTFSFIQREKRNQKFQHSSGV